MDKKGLKKEGDEKPAKALSSGMFFSVVFLVMAAIVGFSVVSQKLNLELGSYGILFYVVVGFILLDLIILLHKLFKYRLGKKAKPKKTEEKKLEIIKEGAKAELKKEAKKEARKPKKGIFSGLFQGKREKTAPEPAEKKPAKAEVKKAGEAVLKKPAEKKKEVKKREKKPGTFYFAVFLISITLFMAAYFYSDAVLGAAALILMLLSLVGYRKSKAKKEKTAPEPAEKKPAKAEVKKEVKIGAKKEARPFFRGLPPGKKEAAEKPPEKKPEKAKGKEEKKVPGTFYFIVFILSIILLVVAYLYDDVYIGRAALLLMFLSIIGYRKPKVKKEKTAPEPAEKKPEKAGEKKAASMVVKKPKKEAEPFFKRPGLFRKKAGEKPAGKKPVKAEKKNKGAVFFFILFLLSIILFVIAFFTEKITEKSRLAVMPLVLLLASLLGYRIAKARAAAPKRFEKETRIMLSKLSEEKEKPKKGKIEAVKELPKSLKIELSGHETDFDVLYKILEQKGCVKVSALAKYFNVDKKKIEEWATILEEHNLAKVQYPPFGEVEIRKWEK